MTIKEFISKFKNNLKLYIFLVNVFVLLSIFVSLVIPIAYRSDFSVMTISNSDNDVYNSIKSADKFADFMGKIIHTDKFFAYVLKTDYDVSMSDFNVDSKKRRKEWENMILTSRVPDSGIVDFQVFGETQKKSSEYAFAIKEVLVNEFDVFYGDNTDLTIKELNSIVVSSNPKRPNFLLNLAIGLVTGLIVASTVIYTKK